jgi:uncharacterized membrane protein
MALSINNMAKYWLNSAAFCACLQMLPGTAGTAAAAEFIPLGFVSDSPPGKNRASFVRQISDDGQFISGTSYGAQGTGDVFRWMRNVGMTSVAPGDGNPSPHPTMAADGSTISWGLLLTNPNGQGRIWTAENGLMTFPSAIEGTGGGGSFGGVGISDDGSIVAGRVGDGVVRWTATDGEIPLANSPGYARTGTTDMSADGNVIAAAFFNDIPGPFEPFRWTATGGWQSLGTTSGASRYSLGDVSSDGTTIIGLSRNNVGESLWRWTMATGITVIDQATPTNSHTDVVSGLARTISADGSVISGNRGRPDGSTLEAYRWTSQLGLEPIPKLPGHVIGLATDMSPDGRWIVGLSYPSATTLANAAVWLWNKETGLFNVRDLMISQGLAPNIAGWKIGESNSSCCPSVYPTISADGHAIAMSGINPQGVIEGWVVYLDSLVGPNLSGDFNVDGTVDASDYVVWRDGIGTKYNAADYDVWRANFGLSVGSGASLAAMPEPSTFFMASLVLASIACQARTQKTLNAQ